MFTDISLSSCRSDVLHAGTVVPQHRRLVALGMYTRSPTEGHKKGTSSRRKDSRMACHSIDRVNIGSSPSYMHNIDS
jgi:hypothetical protein